MPFSKIAQKVATSVFTLKVPKVKIAQAVALFLAPFSLFFCQELAKLAKFGHTGWGKINLRNALSGFFPPKSYF